MAVDKNTSGGPGAPAEEETPDWTTWLRSRLERVVAPDPKGSGGTAADPGAAAVDTPSPGSGSDGFDLPVVGGPPEVAPAHGDVAEARLARQVEVLAEATTACRAMIEEQSATTERLAAWVQELATVQADDERWAAAVGRVVDAADDERRAADEQAGAALAALTSRLEGIEEGLRRVSSEMAALRRQLARPAATAVKLAEPQVHAVAARIAAAMSSSPGTTAAEAQRRAAPPGDEGAAGAGPPPRRSRRATSLRAVPPGPSTRRA